MQWWMKRDNKKLKMKAELFVLQQGICPYCGKQMTMDEATLDRVIPEKLGGTYSFDNLVATHLSCNQKKGNSMKRMYIRKLRKYNWLDFKRIYHANRLLYILRKRNISRSN